MICTHSSAEKSHKCFAPSVGWLTPCKGCPTPVKAQKYITESKRVLRKVPLYPEQKLPISFQEIEDKRRLYDRSLSEPGSSPGDD